MLTRCVAYINDDAQCTMKMPVITFFVIYLLMRYITERSFLQDMQVSGIYVKRTFPYHESVTDPKLDYHELLPLGGAEGLPHPCGCLHGLQCYPASDSNRFSRLTAQTAESATWQVNFRTVILKSYGSSSGSGRRRRGPYIEGGCKYFE